MTTLPTPSEVEALIRRLETEHVPGTTGYMEASLALRAFSRAVEARKRLSLTRAGKTLQAIAQVLPGSGEITIAQIRQEIDAPDKEIYNAMGYLTRKGLIERIGYGRYKPKDPADEGQ